MESAQATTTETTTETTEPTQMTATAKRLLETKINGKPVKVAEEDLLRDYSKYSSADEKFREAAAAKKEVDAFKKAFDEDPEKALAMSKLPKDKKLALAEKWLAELIEEETAPEKTREQQELEDLRRKLKEKEDAENEDRSKKEQEEFQKVVAIRREEIAKTITDALAITPLAKDPNSQAEMVREMAMYMRLCKESGYEPDAKELADHVAKRFTSSITSIVENLDGEDLINALGKSIINKVRKYDLAQLEARNAPKAPDVSENWESSGSKKRKREFVNPRDLIKR